MLLFLFFWGRKIGDWKVISTLISGWAIKCLAAFGFFYVYSEVYGKGELVEDAGAYIQEAKILNQIHEDDKSDYYNVIFNRYDYEKTIIRYFQDVKISRIGPPAFLVNDTRNQIKFISILTLIIGDGTFSVFAFFALLSFIGLLVLWKSISAHTNLNRNITFLLLLLPISLLFWTSSPLKESTSLLGLELLIAAAINNFKASKWILIGLIGLLFAWLFKPYIVVIIALSYIALYLFKKIILQKKWSYGLTIIALGIALAYFSFPNKILNTVSDKQFDFVNVARGGVHMEGDTCYYFLEKENRDKIVIKDSAVHLNEPIEMIAIEKGKIRREQKFKLRPNQEELRFEYEQFGGSSFFKTKAIDRKWGNLFLAIPESVLNTFLRPYAWSNFFSIQNSILFLENLFYLFLLFKILSRYKNLVSPKQKQLISILLIASLLFSIIIGLTTPVSGAIVRYRIPIQLFILVSFIITNQKHELKSE